MTALRTDFTIKEARDVTLEFAVTADEGQVITDSAIDFWVARHVGSTAPLIFKSIGVGITITGSLAFTIEIIAEDTEGMEGVYYYEVRVESLDGHRVTSNYGYITVEESLIGGSSE